MRSKISEGIKKIETLCERMPQNTLQLCCLIGTIILLFPSTIITLYTYPVQDDFANALTVKNFMDQGHGLISSTFQLTWEYYLHYSGYYSSLLFTFFFSGLIDCSIWGIRIFQFITVILFHISIYVFVRTALIHLLRQDRKMVMPVYFLLTVCRTCLYYYIENEDLYWFCASVIYLTLMALAFVGGSALIYAIDQKKIGYLILAVVCGFFVGGAVLNVAALGCFLYLLVAFWGIVVKKQVKYPCIGFCVIFVCAVVNSFCPANFSRRGTPITMNVLMNTVTQSFLYVIDRIKMFVLEYPIFDAVLIILFLFLLCQNWQKKEEQFRLPLLFTIVMFLGIILLVFPVMLGYGPEVYSLMERSNYVSDFGIVLFAFSVLFYWRGWMAVHFRKANISSKYQWIAGVAMIVIILAGTKLQHLGRVPVIRQYGEWADGKYSAYADFCINVYDQIESTEGEVIEIIIPWIEDDTCMINPHFVVGDYDSDVVFGNRTLAEYYGKKVVYMFTEE